MISTRNLSLLAEPEQLWLTLQSMAILDAILCPEWEYRYYSCQCKWGNDVRLGRMRNGCGDEFYASFYPFGALIIGFAHEYPMTPYAHRPPKNVPGVIDNVPRQFDEQIETFRDERTGAIDATFCIWHMKGSSTWAHGDIDFEQYSAHRDPDGSEFLLSPLDGNPRTYHAFAESYFDPGTFDGVFHVNLAAVEHVFAQRPLSNEIVATLNPDLTVGDLAEDLVDIGYRETTG